MKKIAKQLLVATAVMFFLVGMSSVTTAATNPYTDVKASSYYYTAVVTLTADKIITGKSNSQFGVDAKVTRAETAQYIANALQLNTKNVKDPGFKDVPKTHPNYGAIAALANKGIINGVGSNKFAPNQTLERYQIAKIITLAFDLTLTKNKQSNFKDLSKLSANLQSYVHTLVAHGITNGTSVTTFSPYSAVKKQDLALLIYRAIDMTEDLIVVDID